MKLKDLKDWVNNLPEEELKKQILFNSVEYGLSGTVTEINKNDEDLFYVDDEPAILFTKGELLKRGFTEKQIKNMVVEVPAGCYFVELNHDYYAIEEFIDKK